MQSDGGFKPKQYEQLKFLLAAALDPTKEQVKTLQRNVSDLQVESSNHHKSLNVLELNLVKSRGAL